MQRPDSGPLHVVVVGGGFGGLRAVHDLQRVRTDRDLFITLVDKRNHHTFQPLLYQVATAGLAPNDVGQGLRQVHGAARTALGRWLTRRRNPVNVVMGEVVAIDRPERRLTLGDGRVLAWDLLVLAGGAVTNDFGLPGVVEHGWRLKSLRQATGLRDHLIRQFEYAATDPAHIDDGSLTFVVAGGGPTGVEMAGAIAELAFEVMARDHPTFDVREHARVVLLEMGDRLLPAFAPELGDKAAQALEQAGVDVRLGTALASAGRDHVTLADRHRIDTATLVWVAGVRPAGLAELVDAELMRGGRVRVNDHLQVPDDEHVFVVGDMAGAPSDDQLLPQVAPVAQQQASHVAEVIAADLGAGPDPGPFTYRDKGSMATIGRNHAVAELPGGLKLSGWLGWIAWLLLHLVTLVGFRNRVSVAISWIHNWWTWDRSSRLIIDPPRPGGRDAEICAAPVHPRQGAAGQEGGREVDGEDPERSRDDDGFDPTARRRSGRATSTSSGSTGAATPPEATGGDDPPSPGHAGDHGAD